MGQKGLKLAFLADNSCFSGIFLSGIGGYPLPLTPYRKKSAKQFLKGSLLGAGILQFFKEYRITVVIKSHILPEHL